MSKVLYIKANPKATKDSYSLQVGEEFLNAYKDKNPQDEIVKIDVYKDTIPLIDYDVMEAWDILGKGGSFTDLSEEQANKIQSMSQLVDQFVEADKYIFVSPLWNYSVPPMLKAYIDTICIAGKTFKYTEMGPVGLLEGKKALHIQASGGIFSEGPATEHGNSYMHTVAEFLGIKDVQDIYVEGTAIPTFTPEDLKAKAQKDINDVLTSF